MWSDRSVRPCLPTCGRFFFFFMRGSTIWRVRDEADLKRHGSVYWLNSDDTDFDTKAHEICELYVKARQRGAQQGGC